MKLLAFEEKLKSVISIAQINRVLKEYLNDLGIQTYVYTYYANANSQNELKYDYSTEDFSVWHKHYIDQKYGEIDTTLDIVYQATAPIFWNLQEQLKEAKTVREKQMRLDSIAFGAEQGLSVPIHGPHEDFSILLLVQMRGQNCLQNWKELQYELFNVGYLYYSYLQRQLIKIQARKNKNSLNEREMECLNLFAKNFSVSAVAEKLNITVRTVNYYSQRINKKLGTKNKYQSVMKALHKGLIQL